MLAVVGVGIFFGRDAFSSRFGGVADYSGSGEGSVSIEVAKGDTSTNIAATLVAKGVVKSKQAFNQAADANPESRSIQPGFYTLHKKMSGEAALTLMLSPESHAAGITIPEGKTVTETLELLAAKTHTPLDDLKAAAKNTDALNLPPEAQGKLEGFLYPSTYSFGSDQTPTEMLKMMVDTYRQNVQSDKIAEAAARFGISEYDVLIVASLVEKEGITPDFGKVSRVVYNRLAKGMRLQFDSTINYALGRNNIRVSGELLETNSPYNTYRNAGLPPGPISNPGQAAMDAALNPADGPWVYFVKASKDGKSFFTDDKTAFDEQVAKAREEGVF